MILFCSDYKSRATTTPCYFYKKALIGECPQCGEPVTGLTDKVYYSTRCESDGSKAKADKLQLPVLLIPEPSLRSSVEKVKQPAVFAVSKYEVQLRKMECDYQERLKQMESDERERDRKHRVHQVEKQLKDERRVMAEMMLRLQTRYRQLIGQPTRDLPDADGVKGLHDLEQLAYLPVPEKMEPLPTAIKKEAKAVFKTLINDKTEEWTKGQLSETFDHIIDLLGLVRKWQSAHPKIRLSDQPQHTILVQIESSLQTRLSKLKRIKSVWGEPTIELNLGQALIRGIERFLLQ